MTIKKTLAVAFVVAVFVGQIQAGVISNGSLTVDIRSDNGAIDAVTFGGYDFYNPGSPVSDFGVQFGTNTATFRLNSTSEARESVKPPRQVLAVSRHGLAHLAVCQL